MVKPEYIQTLSPANLDLGGKRLVYVGETHNAYQDHLVQLDLLKQFHDSHPDMAIGVEWFQKPYQQALDDYIAGRIDEAQMLQKTEYFSRWRFDYRLYRPIMHYAREHGIPVIALNATTELVQAISGSGIAKLPEPLKAQLPASYDFNDTAYRDLLQDVFDRHPDQDREFQHFYEAQLTWDETMAEGIAGYLDRHPDHAMIVFAGRGHISHRHGIPSRVTRRIALDDLTVLIRNRATIDTDMADYLVFVNPVSLPAAGRMGAFLRNDDRGVRISGLVPGSAAEQAGLKKDDIITAVDGRPTRTYSDLKTIIMDKQPGDRVDVTYLRKRWLLSRRERKVDFALVRPQMPGHHAVKK